MKQSLVLGTLLSLMIMTQISNAQVQRDWVTKFDNLGFDITSGIATDKSGNVWICGNTTNGGADIYTAKFNSAGSQIATAFFGGALNRNHEARGIAIDPNGNVYVLGIELVQVGMHTRPDIVVIKYNSSAVQQWATTFRISPTSADDAKAIAVDALGNVYITGFVVTDSAQSDYLTAKFNTSGVLQWSAIYNGTAFANDIANDIAVDASGNIYVTGSSTGQIGNLFVINTSLDYVTIKYNSNGVQQWVRRFNSSNSVDEARSIALDAIGSVYVTGRSFTSSTNQDCVTLKYSTDGVQQWKQVFAGIAGKSDESVEIAVDGSGNAFITGSTTNSSGNIDVLAVKYNSSGVQQWQVTHNVGANDKGKFIGVDQFGNVYVAGETAPSGSNLSDIVVFRFNSSGSLVWLDRFNGQENQGDLVKGMVVVHKTIADNAKIYIVGISTSDALVIQYSQPPIIGQAASLATVTKEIASKNIKVEHYPNPVNSFANIQFDLPTDCRVAIDIYDALGRKVYTLFDGFQKAGTHMTIFNAASFAEGLYYYKIYAIAGTKEFRQTKTMVIHR
jgi:uncharacterized delta-60 repeat protein